MLEIWKIGQLENMETWKIGYLEIWIFGNLENVGSLWLFRSLFLGFGDVLDLWHLLLGTFGISWAFLFIWGCFKRIGGSSRRELGGGSCGRKGAGMAALRLSDGGEGTRNPTAAGII